jgi:cell shape-determining protein MreD
MKILLIIFFSAAVVVLQLAALPWFDIFFAVPNLILALTIAWAIYEKNEKFSWLILTPAILFDLLAGRPFGLFTLCLWLTFFLIRRLSQALFKQSGFISLLTLSIVGVIFNLVLFSFLAKFAEFIHLPGALARPWSDFYYWPILVATISSDIILCFLIFYFFKKIQRPLDAFLSPSASI